MRKVMCWPGMRFASPRVGLLNNYFVGKAVNGEIVDGNTFMLCCKRFDNQGVKMHFGPESHDDALQREIDRTILGHELNHASRA